MNHPKPQTSALMRSGHVPVHQPVPFRRAPPHPMAAAGGSSAHYHNTSHLHQPQRLAFNPHHRPQPGHLGGPPPPEASMSKPFQPHRPPMDRHQSISRSPSPPPAPPSEAQAISVDNAPRPAPTSSSDRRLSDSSFSTLGPLRERHNVQERKPSQQQAAQQQLSNQKPPATADMTADAASILLELRTVMTQKAAMKKAAEEGDQENSTQDVNHMHSNNGKDSFLDKSGDTVGSIVQSSSSDGDASTISPPDESGPPDLTSEPSSDNTEADLPQIAPENFPTRLALPHDDSKLNSLHCFLRSELLEIFVVQKSNNKSPTHSPGSSVGRVGLRCVHCALVRQHHRDDRDEAPMAVFYPKSIAEIYRLVTSWQRCHLRKCRNLPPPVRATWQSLRDNDKSRGKTHYWVTSAKEIGLVDCQSRAGGIRFGPEAIKRFLEEAASKGKEIGDATMSDEADEANEQKPLTEVTATTTVDAPRELEEVSAPAATATTAEAASVEAASVAKDKPLPEVTTDVAPSLGSIAAAAALATTTPAAPVEAMLTLKKQLPPTSEVTTTDVAPSLEPLASSSQVTMTTTAAAAPVEAS